MDFAAITAPAVRQALRAARYGAGPQGNPLSALDVWHAEEHVLTYMHMPMTTIQ